VSDPAGNQANLANLANARALKRITDNLQRSDKGVPIGNANNALLILRYDPALLGLLGYCEFTSRYLMLRAPPSPDESAAALPGPYPRPIKREDVGAVLGYIQRSWIGRIGRDVVTESMVTAAAFNRFHPVRDWLASLAWDGTPRLDGWTHHAFGAPNDDYHNDAGAKFLIAAVRRVRQPGCKFDHMLMLEGKTGIGKSTALRALYHPWFSDSMRAPLHSREAAMSLAGAWCFEFAEIDQLLRAETETIKAFVTTQVDQYRPPYAPDVLEFPRQCVLAGSTNTDDYLRDATGNRRFWPILCAFVDLDWIAANRAQLWAEAAAREASGEAIYLDDIASAEGAEREQHDRQDTDVWTSAVLGYLDGRMETAIHSILSDGLSVPIGQQEKRHEVRVGRILRRHGWIRTKARLEGKPAWRWKRNLILAAGAAAADAAS
jgi:putative DNA primase/helicase